MVCTGPPLSASTPASTPPRHRKYWRRPAPPRCCRRRLKSLDVLSAVALGRLDDRLLAKLIEEGIDRGGFLCGFVGALLVAGCAQHLAQLFPRLVVLGIEGERFAEIGLCPAIVLACRVKPAALIPDFRDVRREVCGRIENLDGEILIGALAEHLGAID